MCHIKIYQNQALVNLKSGGVLLRGTLSGVDKNEHDDLVGEAVTGRPLEEMD